MNLTYLRITGTVSLLHDAGNDGKDLGAEKRDRHNTQYEVRSLFED